MWCKKRGEKIPGGVWLHFGCPEMHGGIGEGVDLEAEAKEKAEDKVYDEL